MVAKKGDFMLCEDFRTSGGKSVPEAIARAGKELEGLDVEDTIFVVQIVAVVRRKKGFDVE